MPPTLIVETGEGLSTSNSYATVAEAETFFDRHLYATDWSGATADTKTRALIWATRLLDEQVAWHGSKSTTPQALRWPRIGVYDRDQQSLISSNVVPTWLKEATAELARYLIRENRTEEPETQGLSQISVGPLELQMDKEDRKAILPRSVMSLLAPFGSIRGFMTGMVKLQRV